MADATGSGRRMSKRYAIYVCGDDPPSEEFPGMVNRFYFGLVPCDFNERKGTSKTHFQKLDETTGRYVWYRRDNRERAEP